MKCAITMLVACLLVAATGVAAQAVSEPKGSGEGLPVAFRTRVATHYRLPDGSLRAVITIRPQNYRDGSGQWHAIDTTLVTGAEHPFVNLTNGLMTRFPSSSAQGVELEGVNQPVVEMTPVRFFAIDSHGNLVTELSAKDVAAHRFDEQTVHYRELFAGVTDEYIVDTDRLKHNLVVAQSALDAMKESTRFGGEFRIDVPAGLKVVAGEGERTIRFMTEQGECVYEIGSVFATDAEGKTTRGHLVWHLEGQKLLVSMCIDTAWALESDRAWPVRIDPTFSVQPDGVVGKDTMVRDGAPTSSYGTNTDITINYSGNVTQEALVEFDLTSIASTGTVNTAQFEMWHRANTVTGHVWHVNEYTQSWNEATVTWNTKPTFTATPATTLTYTNGAPNVWRVYTGMEVLAQGWVATPANNFGFRIFNTTNTNALAYHRSSDYATTTERPKFIADYTTNVPPTIELPASGTAFSGNMGSGFTANVPPAAMANMHLELTDVDMDPIEVVSVSVAPSAPAGITAPVPSTNNPSGTIISFTGDAAQSVPGTYTWTITIDDGFGPAMADVSITIADEAPTHVAGANAASGDGSIANPYAADLGLGGTPTVDLANVSDLNVPQTLTQVSVTPDPANPTSKFMASYSGTGNTGVVSATATSVVTYGDIGVHKFTVVVTDGTTPIDIVVSLTVQNVGNVQPTVAPGAAFAGTRAAGFTMSVNPGQALAGATLQASDLDADDIEIVSVQVVPAVGMMGVTAPATAAPAAGPIALAWTGTASANEVPGAFVYTITISDGITPPVTFDATITMADIAPVHVPVAGVNGTGAATAPYAFVTQVGKTPALDICTVADQNLSQTVILGTVTPDPLNPTGGAGFTIALAAGKLTISANAALKSKDVGAHVYTVDITDGSNTTQLHLRVKVNKVPSDSDNGGSGCASPAGSTGILALLAALAGLCIAVRLRPARSN